MAMSDHPLMVDTPPDVTMIVEFFAWLVQQHGPIQIELSFPHHRRSQQPVKYWRLSGDDLVALLQEYGELRTSSDEPV